MSKMVHKIHSEDTHTNESIKGMNVVEHAQSDSELITDLDELKDEVHPLVGDANLQNDQ